MIMKTINYNISWYTGTSRGTLETGDPVLAKRLHHSLSSALGHEPHTIEVIVNAPALETILGPELPGFGVRASQSVRIAPAAATANGSRS